jgi:glutamyl-tRNA(Gln) amidotransferase subunit D
MPNAGDRVIITTKETEETGILVLSPKPETHLLKLDNGYNMGFHTKNIMQIKVVEKAVVPVSSSHKKEKNSKLKTVAILHTGGTIASKVDYRTGGVSSEFTPEELVALFPELQDICNVESELIAQMWSDDIRFPHFELIAKAIEKYVKKGVDGVVIGMGTDNLAVTAAALSFIVESSPIPIIFVGAQRSSDRGSSDAAMNVICAAHFITQTDFGGVAICMHEHSSDSSCAILPGTKTYKLHSSRRDAFQAINDTAIASVNYKTGKVKMYKGHYRRKKKELILKPKMEDKVGLLKIHINMFPEQFLVYKGFKGLILEGTGLGHMPIHIPNEQAAIHAKIKDALQEIIDSGCVVVMTTQCLFGSTNMNVYSKARDLTQMGVVAGQDMLASTAFVKLSWLLANNDSEKVSLLMQQNLRDEINEQLAFDETFVKR